MIGDSPSKGEQSQPAKTDQQSAVPSITGIDRQETEQASARRDESNQQQRVAKIAALRRRKRRKATLKVCIEISAALATVAIAVLSLAYVHYSRKQWETMSRQMNDYEAGEAASIAIMNFAIKDFPDKPEVVFDVSNEGRTRADQILPWIGTGTIAPKDEIKFFVQEHALGGAMPNINGFSPRPF